MATTLGWIGTGIMGRSMCGHLLAGGHGVQIYSRTRSKAEDLIARGARWADSPAAAVRGADIVFTMVGLPSDVREVYFGESGIFGGVKPGTVLVDMTTTEPRLAVEIADRARALSATAVDAPVSGGDVGARNATLSIMIGGDPAGVERVRPFFELMGKNLVHQGGPGAGQHTKMSNQIVIAGTMIGVVESLLYATRAGLDLETMLRSIRSGAAGCWTIENLAPRVIARNFDPGFMVEHFIKDMGIALAEAEKMNLSLPGLGLAKQLYESVRAIGYGRKGTQALLLALEKMSGIAR
jgi:3-hydroxyisobutyrate dehydrogenase